MLDRLRGRVSQGSFKGASKGYYKGNVGAFPSPRKVKLFDYGRDYVEPRRIRALTERIPGFVHLRSGVPSVLRNLGPFGYSHMEVSEN